MRAPDCIPSDLAPEPAARRSASPGWPVSHGSVPGRSPARAEQIGGADAERLIADLAVEARHDFRHFGSQPDNDDPLFTDTVRHRIQHAARRRVDVRLICGTDETENHIRQRFLRDVAALPHGGVRVSTERPQGICIVDRHTALTWSDGPARRDYVLTRSPTLIEPLMWLFDSVWATAVDLPTFLDAGTDDDGIRPRVLELLADGLKDDTAARTLGVSVRTYRRHVADMMSRLNARSRFEAGLRAGRLQLM